MVVEESDPSSQQVAELGGLFSQELSVAFVGHVEAEPVDWVGCPGVGEQVSFDPLEFFMGCFLSVAQSGDGPHRPLPQRARSPWAQPAARRFGRLGFIPRQMQWAFHSGFSTPPAAAVPSRV